MPLFSPPLQLLTPFGLADCTERVDDNQRSFWICWPKETGICFWFKNQEVRMPRDLSDGRYEMLPFELPAERIAALDELGKHHSYWRAHIVPRG